MHKDIGEILITEEELAAKVKEMGKAIDRVYGGRPIKAICVLTGAVVFYTDIIRAISSHVCMDFMAVSSYGSGVKTTGTVKIVKDLDEDVVGQDVLIIEDILDTGLTLQYVTNILASRNARSIRICTLMDKPDRRKADIKADFIGFTIPDEFVVGYGLDYDGLYRNLPYVGILKPEVYGK